MTTRRISVRVGKETIRLDASDEFVAAVKSEAERQRRCREGVAIIDSWLADWQLPRGEENR